LETSKAVGNFPNNCVHFWFLICAVLKTWLRLKAGKSLISQGTVSVLLSALVHEMMFSPIIRST
jgi:hypothetical protein